MTTGRSAAAPTIAYGAFRCRLEGFDDPFPVIEAIAGLIRDLAHDRICPGRGDPGPETAQLLRLVRAAGSASAVARVEAGTLVLRERPDTANGCDPRGEAPADGGNREGSDIRSERNGRSARPEGEDDATFRRILSQTDDRLREDAGSRRRAAFAHMRAAVAATRAEARGRRPAPLLLGNDLRVDTPDAPIRPAGAVRVSHAVPAASHPGKTKAACGPDEPGGGVEAPVDFTGFAAAAGATELEDVIEAAAAHTVFIDGRTEFSRPMVMGKVAICLRQRGGFTRRQGPAAFDAVVCSGRITRVGRGRFTVAPTTRFRPAPTDRPA